MDSLKTDSIMKEFKELQKKQYRIGTAMAIIPWPFLLSRLQDAERIGREGERKIIRKNIGFLRQWLNENRITDGEMVTNENLETMLEITHHSKLSPCKNCYCMTKTIKGKCGKCGGLKMKNKKI